MGAGHSQFLNLLAFRRHGAAPLGVHWTDYGVGCDILKGMDEVVAVRQLEDTIEHSTRDANIIGAMRQDISDALTAAGNYEKAAALKASQTGYFESLGGVGTEDAIDCILEVFHG